MMTHILSNLPKDYQNTIEILEDKLDDEENPLTIERINDKLFLKYDQMNEQPTKKTSREDEKPFYMKSQYKGTCKTCGRCGH